MTLAVLEFNDQSLQIKSATGSLYSEPGFARMHPQGIETGDDARSRAWLEPQNSYNQYWVQLNQTPLAAQKDWARNHADIAYAQLKNLWLAAGSPESLILLVPGSFNDAQLSLLLGMASALPAEIKAVADSALVASTGANESQLYVDMQMHQSVITLCRHDGNTIRIADQEVFPDLGMIQILNSVASYISKLLIDSSRYDPMHASDTEQDIFDRIPEWLARLRWESELSDTINSEHGELPFILRNDDIARLANERLANVRSFINRYADTRLVLSSASGVLTGLAKEFSDAQVADPGAGIDFCLENESIFSGQSDELARIRSLEYAKKSPVERKGEQRVEQKIATHLLYQNQALPLSSPLSISVNGQGLLLSNSMDKDAVLTVVKRNNQLEVVRCDSSIVIALPENCAAGEEIVVGDYQLRLIRVRHEV